MAFTMAVVAGCIYGWASMLSLVVPPHASPTLDDYSVKAGPLVLNYLTLYPHVTLLGSPSSSELAASQQTFSLRLL